MAAAGEMIVCENLVKIYTLANGPGPARARSARDEHARAGVDVVALQGLDLSVAAGEMVGIVGESGSGKSTLLNVLGGLDRPSAGRAQVDGQDLARLNESELDHYRCRSVGFVWQQTTRNLVPYLSALENVALGLRLAGLPAAKRQAQAQEWLAAVGLADRTADRPGQLSGGEQQRVAIAVALANHPALLLADEPTGELDTSTAQEIYTLLRKINREHGTTMLIVSHDPAISRQVERVVAIRDGKTSSETVRLAPQTSQAALQAPTSAPSALSAQSAQFEEYLMLDSAGRVQIPREILLRLGIAGRLRLEVAGEDILLRPVDGHRRPAQTATGETDEEPPVTEDHSPGTAAPSLANRLRRWLKWKLK